MKKLLLILLFPISVSAQFSTYELVADSVKKIAQKKADSIFSILKTRIDSAVTAIPTAANPKGLATSAAVSNKADAVDLSNKVNVTDTPQIRTRSVGSAVATIVQNFLKDYTRTDSMQSVLAAMNSNIATRLLPSDTNKLRNDINANKALIVARDSIMMLLGRVDSVKTRTLFTQTVLNTVANTAIKSSMVGSGVGSLTIPANTLVPGKTFRMRIEGVYSTPVLLNIANITCRMELNNVPITTGTATSLLASASNSAFSAEMLITIRTVGTSGTLAAIGGLNFNSTGGTRIFVDWNTGTTTANINTTISNTFTPTIQFSNNNNGNSVSSVICTFEALN